MNSKSNESNENIPEIGKTVEESNATQKRSLSDANDVGKLSSKSMMFRADMVDLKNFDNHTQTFQLSYALFSSIWS